MAAVAAAAITTIASSSATTAAAVPAITLPLITTTDASAIAIATAQPSSRPLRMSGRSNVPRHLHVR